MADESPAGQIFQAAWSKLQGLWQRSQVQHAANPGDWVAGLVPIAAKMMELAATHHDMSLEQFDVEVAAIEAGLNAVHELSQQIKAVIAEIPVASTTPASPFGTPTAAPDSEVK